MWFHNVIGEGAGLFPGDLDRDMQLVGRTEVQDPLHVLSVVKPNKE